MDEIICRLCLRRSIKLFSIFEKRETPLPYQPYQQLLHLKLIQINFTGSSHICAQCLAELDNCVKFFKKCEESNKAVSYQNTKNTSLDLLNACVDQNQGKLIVSPDECTLTKLAEEPLESNAEKSNADKCNAENSNAEQINAENPIEDDDFPVPDPKGQKKPAEDLCTKTGKSNRKHTGYKCEICHKNFVRKCHYTIHVKRHLDIREYPCPTCGLPQVTRSYAKHHCARNRFQCPVLECPKSFTYPNHLKLHMRIRHTAEKPYNCAECGNCYSSTKSLNDHVRLVHTGPKPHVCPVCGERFTTQRIAAHLRKHNKSKKRPRRAGTHPCAYCKNVYTYKYTLTRHVKKEHADSQVPAESSAVQTEGN